MAATLIPRRQLFIDGKWTEPVLRKRISIVNLEPAPPVRRVRRLRTQNGNNSLFRRPADDPRGERRRNRGFILSSRYEVRRTDVLSAWSGIQRYVRMKKTYSGKIVPVAMDTAAAKHLSHAYGTAAERVAAIAQVCSSQCKKAKESLSCTTRIAEFLCFCTRCQQMLP